MDSPRPIFAESAQFLVQSANVLLGCRVVCHQALPSVDLMKRQDHRLTSQGGFELCQRAASCWPTIMQVIRDIS
ncbi:hypothetical protein ATO1_17245 [Phaeobacter sp. 22II1-1F12B]|nr:hypothetical protein ATO1_17245 [Phaeobacter sp. 22II1-1F12B]